MERFIRQSTLFIIGMVMLFWGCSGPGQMRKAPIRDTNEFKKVKNVIIMISDGAGYNTHLSTEYWHGKKQPYDNADFIKYTMTTYSLRKKGLFGPPPNNNSQDPAMVYDPVKAWDDTALPEGTDKDADGYLDYFKGYQWLQATDPDSASTMSAMVTGIKVYRGGINVDGFGEPILTAPEIAKAVGKSCGSISSVRYNHSTPAAAGGAHNISRGNYLDISYEMFGSGVLDVMGGPGHPWYTSKGALRPRPKLKKNRFDASLWEVISNGSGIVTRTTVDGREFTVDGSDWEMVEDKIDILNLANGATTVTPGKKLFMLPRVWGTLQYERDITQDWDGDGRIGNRHPVTRVNLDLQHAPVNPGDDSNGDPFIDTVPNLGDMTKAAINFLDDNPMGFYLQVEGGACDWAMHGNSMARMIEEHSDFNKAVQFVIDYLNTNTNGNNWENTLLIITSDHDHNLYGPESDTIAFQDVSDEGIGQNPGHIWHGNNHGNQIVPMWIRGPNSQLISTLVDGTDPVHGEYIDQIDIGFVILGSLLAEENAEGDVE